LSFHSPFPTPDSAFDCPSLEGIRVVYFHEFSSLGES
jgi:hypothetical protein